MLLSASKQQELREEPKKRKMAGKLREKLKLQWNATKSLNNHARMSQLRKMLRSAASPRVRSPVYSLPNSGMWRPAPRSQLSPKEKSASKCPTRHVNKSLVSHVHRLQ